MKPAEPGKPARLPVYVRIQRMIRDSILSGALTVGDRIPSETELAQKFDTTRATVARALQELVFDGTIIRRAGAGSFVAPGGASLPLDAGHLRSFEEQAAEIGETVAYQLVEFAPVAAPAPVMARLGLAGTEKPFHLERLRLIGGVALSLESRFIPAAVAAKITAGDLTGQSVHRIIEEAIGIRIARIEASIRAGAATQHIARLLALPKGRPLLVRDHVLVDGTDRPILMGTSYYTERFKLDYVVYDR